MAGASATSGAVAGEPAPSREAMSAVGRAALRTVEPGVSKSVWLNETGREGTFRWRTGDYSARVASDPLEGLYLKAEGVPATSGAWERVYTDLVDVRWFGATGGGVVDDSPAIQAAVRALYPYGGTIFFPPGTYLVGKTININGFNSRVLSNLPRLFTKRLRILGAGSGTTRLVGGEPGYGFFEFLDACYLHFEGFSIFADRTTDLPQFGLLGGRARGNISAGNHTVRDVHVLGRFAKCGAFFLSSEMNRFANCTWYPQQGHGCVMAMNNSDWAMSPRYGVFGSGLGGNGDNQFDNCVFMSGDTSRADDVLLALEYAQAFHLKCCYFVSSRMKSQVMLRKSASGTFENIFSENQGPVDPYTIYFAPDDPHDTNDYIDYRDIILIGGRALGIYAADDIRITNMQVLATVFRGRTSAYQIDVGKLYDSRIEISNRLPNVTLNLNQKIRIRQENRNNAISGASLTHLEAPFPSLDSMRLTSNAQVELGGASEDGGVLTDAMNNYSGITATLHPGNVPGERPFSLYLDFLCPTLIDSNVRLLVGLGRSTTNLSASNTVSVHIAQGNLWVRSFGPTATGENTFRCVDSFVPNFAGKRVKLLLVREGSTPALYVNGYRALLQQAVATGGREWTQPIDGNVLMVGFQSFATASNSATWFTAAGLFNYAVPLERAHLVTLKGLLTDEPWAASAGGQERGCVGWWDFENGGGTSIFDQSPHGQTATISGQARRRQVGLRRTAYRVHAGPPTGRLTPDFIGEEVLDTEASRWYKSTGLANGAWAPLT